MSTWIRNLQYWQSYWEKQIGAGPVAVLAMSKPFLTLTMNTNLSPKTPFDPNPHGYLARSIAFVIALSSLIWCGCGLLLIAVLVADTSTAVRAVLGYVLTIFICFAVTAVFAPRRAR